MTEVPPESKTANRLRSLESVGIALFLISTAVLLMNPISHALASDSSFLSYFFGMPRDILVVLALGTLGLILQLVVKGTAGRVASLFLLLGGGVLLALAGGLATMLACSLISCG